jgi:hypothetical protein
MAAGVPEAFYAFVELGQNDDVIQALRYSSFCSDPSGMKTYTAGMVNLL